MLRERIPDDASFVHEIAEILCISYDSAYRRIRGEKALDIIDLHKLASAFNVSVDKLFKLEDKRLLFDYFTLEPDNLGIKDWLNLILEDTKKIYESANREIIYAAKDPPVFHNFQIPELAAFKIFFWQKTLCNFPEFRDRKLRLDDADMDIINTGRQLLSVSNKIPTIEIWNEDTFNITLRQIEYYMISGYFEKKDDIFNLCDKLQKWVAHLSAQAEHGFKYMFGQPAEGVENSFRMYENEVVLNDNTILVRKNASRKVYLTFNTLSLLVSSSPVFCDNVDTYFDKLIRKSNLMSVSGAKARNRFFNKLLSTINDFRKKVSG